MLSKTGLVPELLLCLSTSGLSINAFCSRHASVCADSLGVQGEARPKGDNIYEWEGVINGPEGTAYEGGKFR